MHTAAWNMNVNELSREEHRYAVPVSMLLACQNQIRPTHGES